MLAAWVVLCSAVATTTVPPECSEQCATGISGIEGISTMLNRVRRTDGDSAVCKHYAATVMAADSVKACGHASLGEAIEQCAFGIPPKHCFRHKNAGVAVVVTSHISAVAVWFPIASMIATLD